MPGQCHDVSSAHLSQPWSHTVSCRNRRPQPLCVPDVHRAGFTFQQFRSRSGVRNSGLSV
eukprot:6087398-Prymnesium_polylepis.1